MAGRNFAIVIFIASVVGIVNGQPPYAFGGRRNARPAPAMFAPSGPRAFGVETVGQIPGVGVNGLGVAPELSNEIIAAYLRGYQIAVQEIRKELAATQDTPVAVAPPGIADDVPITDLVNAAPEAAVEEIAAMIEAGEMDTTTMIALDNSMEDGSVHPDTAAIIRALIARAQGRSVPAVAQPIEMVASNEFVVELCPLGCIRGETCPVFCPSPCSANCTPAVTCPAICARCHGSMPPLFCDNVASGRRPPPSKCAISCTPGHDCPVSCCHLHCKAGVNCPLKCANRSTAIPHHVSHHHRGAPAPRPSRGYGPPRPYHG